MTAIPHDIQSAFAKIRADYDATRHSRFFRRRTGVAPMGSGADYHFRSESKYYEMGEQARDMDRNDAIVGILADRRVDNIVQSGFTLDPKTGDKGVDTALWDWWEDFSTDPDQCDIAGEATWKEMERQVSRSESIDGDIVVTGTEEGSFQMLESHLIRTKGRTPDTFLGVTTDRHSKRLQYHVAEETGVFGQFGDSTPIDVRNEDNIRQLFHVFNPKRVNVTRGVTQLAPVFAMSAMLEDLNFAKLVQAQFVSCFAVFRKLAAGQSALPSADGVYGEGSTEQTATGTRQIEGISPGMEIIGQPGEDLEGFSPNVPNSEYFQQVKLMLQIIGCNFGLPLCLVLMDGSETNFSGWRGAVDEARKGFVADQMNLVRRFNKPGYTWKLHKHLKETKDSALKKAAAKLGAAFFRHNWNLPTWSYIEPVADAEGDATQLRNALTSPRRLHAARGKDWEEIAEESIADNAYAIERAAKQAQKINEAFPDSPAITWRDLIALPMPAGTTMAMQDPAAVAVQEKTAGADGGDAGPQPTAEMAGLSTLQFTRNRKAIKKILDELASGVTSEAAARVYLGGIGLAQQSVDALIADAMDGKVETPEVLDDGSPVAKKKDDPVATFCPTGPGGGQDNSCGGEGGGAGGGAKTRTTKKPMSDQAKRAKAAHVMVDRDIQQAADVAERGFAKAVKGMSFKNSEPVDVVVAGPDGAIEHGIEHKYMFSNSNSKITMNKYAQVRKLEWEKKNKATFHTVVESKEGELFYRRGVGSFRVNGMHKVSGGKKELAKLLKMGDNDLPSGAQRTDSELRVGSWKPAKDGRGYVNSKTGETVRPKK